MEYLSLAEKFNLEDYRIRIIVVLCKWVTQDVVGRIYMIFRHGMLRERYRLTQESSGI